MTLLVGAIADDFTGATDLCNTLVKEGMRTVQVIGVPDDTTDIGDADAVVVALKSRTAPVDLAVSQSVAAHDWLTAHGAAQVVEKYCSTFDSTADGNIGPITDALMERSGAQIAVICPAFPENLRTIYQGHLFVGADLLSDSSMKDHPLTPMRDASLVRLTEAQSKGKAGVVPLQVIRQGPAAIRDAIASLQTQGFSYAVTDAIDPEDLRAIGAAIASHPLVTGGSGIATGLPDNFRATGQLGKAHNPRLPTPTGRKLVLAGSCSQATRQQIARVQDTWPTRKLDIDALATGTDIAAELADWALNTPADTPVLIYSSSDPAEVTDLQAKYGREAIGEKVEQTLGRIATQLVANGFDTLVVAGGETSGAVVSALSVRALRIGPEIAPGVPWTETLGGPPVALALKSGNFGGETFFEDAFGMLT
ncbi:3-oxo-tetronate kinase [Falsiphaeobacter marinintestinus]|uniref:3-oxo-tetronate kinase n=1 Tax=Falsiphaeobacter marinintestinus TaxID=1492905 RepID=UPI0011B56D34|nr:3-oxo-tetronate kinase [Phaeobacter marinintestinus]